MLAAEEDQGQWSVYSRVSPVSFLGLSGFSKVKLFGSESRNPAPPVAVGGADGVLAALRTGGPGPQAGSRKEPLCQDSRRLVGPVSLRAMFMLS